MLKPTIILGVESSCDETAVAIAQNTKDGVKLLSNVVATSQGVMAKYGGVIPEQAAREQLKAIIPVVTEALHQAFPTYDLLTTNYQLPIDAIAVTQGPGLIGSLLVGVETAKTLAIAWNKPLVPINHLIGHFYANWISPIIASAAKPASASDRPSRDGSQAKRATSPTQELGSSTGASSSRNDAPRFPCLGLLVSGGHTDLVLFTGHGRYQYLGGTRDDAAGECFDKSARVLGLPYPGGPQLSKQAETGNPKAFNLPRPMLDSADYDFSFSGLKTAVVNQIKSDLSDLPILSDLSASIEQAIVDCLVKKTVRAARDLKVDQLMVAGGVAANSRLTRELKTNFPGLVHTPPPKLCTDNAAMVAVAAFYNYQPVDPLKLQADPNLSLS